MRQIQFCLDATDGIFFFYCPVSMMSGSLEAEGDMKPKATDSWAWWHINLVAVNVLRRFPPLCVQSAARTSCSVIYNRVTHTVPPFTALYPAVALQSTTKQHACHLHEGAEFISG